MPSTVFKIYNQLSITTVSISWLENPFQSCSQYSTVTFQTFNKIHEFGRFERENLYFHLPHFYTNPAMVEISDPFPFSMCVSEGSGIVLSDAELEEEQYCWVQKGSRLHGSTTHTQIKAVQPFIRLWVPERNSCRLSWGNQMTLGSSQVGCALSYFIVGKRGGYAKQKPKHRAHSFHLVG